MTVATLKALLAALLAVVTLHLAPMSPAGADSILDGKLSGDLDGTLGGRLSGVLPPVRFSFDTRDRKRVCRPYGSGCTYAEIQGEPYDCKTLKTGCMECRVLTTQGSPMTMYWGPQTGWGHCP